MFTTRLATMEDLPALRALMALAIRDLQRGFLSPRQIVASTAVMGLDTQLVADGTYYLAEHDGCIAGCGGWSWRATLYGGDHSASLRDPAVLVPGSDPARIRAMYTHPDFARRGVGRLILQRCEDSARAAGFGEAQLMATLSGEPLYAACGYEAVERIEDGDAVKVPLVRMTKPLV